MVTVKIVHNDGEVEEIKCLYCKARDGFFEVVLSSKPEFKARYFPAASVREIQTSSKENENKHHEDRGE
jgi:hypothetical protein